MTIIRQKMKKYGIILVVFFQIKLQASEEAVKEPLFNNRQGFFHLQGLPNPGQLVHRLT